LRGRRLAKQETIRRELECSTILSKIAALAKPEELCKPALLFLYRLFRAILGSPGHICEEDRIALPLCEA
jgi:hypothetical protein